MTSPLPGVAGSLLPAGVLAGLLRSRAANARESDERAAVRQRFVRWWQRCERSVGPATGVRSVVETLGVELFGLLGFTVGPGTYSGDRAWLSVRAGRHSRPQPVLVTACGLDLDCCWRDVLRTAAGASWTLCWNVRELRLIDSARPWGRWYTAFDLAVCAADDATFTAFWTVCRAAAFRSHTSRGPNAVDVLVTAAAREQMHVCRGVEVGVTESLPLLAEAFLDALPARFSAKSGELLSESLTVIYRLLFLLFAEARALVPMWHPVYRESYSVEALRQAVERRPPFTGLWPAFQATSRLAHRGCRVGSLVVTPFNGHLFSPRHAPGADSARLPDTVLARAIGVLTTRPVRHGAAPVAFQDLGVEQLGAIYERVLDHRLVVDEAATEARAPQRRTLEHRRVRLEATRCARKATATFYTPRALAHLIVRRTLGPLVADASPERILALRILDPAMGSGAFLVAACDYLAQAYERALLREGRADAYDINDEQRASFRRLVARHCLYGVDRNPMAVHLARLSLWLATLARDVPLTFLDHHLRTGDSLLGARVHDLLRQPPGARARSQNVLPLFSATGALDDLDATMPLMRELAELDDDTLAKVRQKEALFERLQDAAAPLTRWREAADLWCSAWFWPSDERAPTRGLYHELLATILERTIQLRPHHVRTYRERVKAIASRCHFFHWTLEFPEVFARGAGGFDAVIGNPPWDVVRADDPRTDERLDARCLAAFVRESGLYTRGRDGHSNVFQLFVERALDLLSPAGRLGLVVPAGALSDHSAAPIRRRLLHETAVDTCVVIDNRRGLFPIHRSLTFVALCGRRGGSTASLPVTQVSGNAAVLDQIPEGGSSDTGASMPIPITLLTRLSGGTLAVPRVKSLEELALLERLSQFPRLAALEGWQVTFGRELNATDDRHLFSPAGTGLPVLEGKHVASFRVRLEQATHAIAEDRLATHRQSAGWRRARLAYRDVASATNERTLIAAVIPSGAVTTHTLFCCRCECSWTRLHGLCALLNSFVANWLVRRWVSTHVTVALIERLPVPAPAALDERLTRLATLAHRLSFEESAAERCRQEARLHASAAAAWQLTRADFEMVLSDFPLVDAGLKHASLTAFDRDRPA
ncbi:MAG: N-6 DNA methylase [Vicinamibacterales bacterium]